MKRTTISLLTLLAFSTSLEAVKFTISGFEGFYDATIGQKMPDWCVKQTPDGPDSDPQHMYKELQIEVFTSQEVPTHRLSGHNMIPAAKAFDKLKKDRLVYPLKIKPLILEIYPHRVTSILFSQLNMKSGMKMVRALEANENLSPMEFYPQVYLMKSMSLGFPCSE